MKKLLLALALLFALPAMAAPVLVQHTSCNVGAARPTAPTCAYSSNVTAGNQLLFWIIDDRVSATITDGPGDTVVANAWFTQTTGGNIWNLLYHVTSAVGGATTVTFTYPGATNFAVVMEEWSGLDTSSLFVDVYKKQANASSTTAACGTTATSNGSNDVVWAVYSTYQGSVYSGGPPSGYSLNDETTNSSADSIHVYGKTASGFSTQTAASLTLSVANINFCTIVTGRAAQPGTVTTSATTSPGTCADLAGVGTVTWTNPTNAQVSDGVYATSSAGTTHYLKCSNFGFSVGGTVVGVKLTVIEDADCTIGCDGTQPLTIKLNLAAGVSGNNRCGIGIYNSSAETTGCAFWSTGGPTTNTYGGQGDTWGLALLNSDVNDTNFGAVISLSNDNTSGGTMTGKVDVMQITVYTLNTVKRRVEIIAQTGYAVKIKGHPLRGGLFLWALLFLAAHESGQDARCLVLCCPLLPRDPAATCRQALALPGDQVGHLGRQADAYQRLIGAFDENVIALILVACGRHHERLSPPGKVLDLDRARLCPQCHVLQPGTLTVVL
jgi:hypothetical protein